MDYIYNHAIVRISPARSYVNDSKFRNHPYLCVIAREKRRVPRAFTFEIFRSSDFYAFLMLELPTIKA